MRDLWIVVEDGSREGGLLMGTPLRQGRLTIGRAGTCDVILPGKRVSRIHAVIERRGDSVTVREDDVAAAPRADGSQEEGRLLALDAVLSIGPYRLRLSATPPSPSPEAARPSNILDLWAQQAKEGPSSAVADWEPFRALMERLQASSDPADLLSRLLLGLVDLLGAERGFVLLGADSGADLVPVASHKIGDGRRFVSISKTVYGRVLERGEVVFVQNTMKDPWYLEACDRSLQGTPRSVLCGPLKAGGTVIGVIYLDGAAVLDASHIPVFESAAAFAAELLRAERTRRRLVAAQGRLGAIGALAWEGERLVSGGSGAARRVEELVAAAAPQDVTVLVTGETGTGKEMVARTIHVRSRRREGPFVPVNCAALPRDIIEAELFGVEKGAFTGATQRRIGRFELASGGTLFLDEIGELGEAVQVKLLRVLEERSIRRLGGAESVPLDFRLLCATNRELEARVREGAFREDLFYRINVFRVHLPPLRLRREDILPLAEHFLAHFRARTGKAIEGFTREAGKVLTAHDWPGNIRELRNAVERAVLVEKGRCVDAASLPVGPGAAVTPAASSGGGWLPMDLPRNYEEARDRFEKAFLEWSLAKTGGNVTAMAREAGMTRPAVYRRLSKYGLAGT